MALPDIAFAVLPVSPAAGVLAVLVVLAAAAAAALLRAAPGGPAAHRRDQRDLALLRALLERSGDVVAVLGDDGRLAGAAGAVPDLLGRGREDLGGEALATLVHPDDRDLLAALAPGAGDVPRQLAWRMRHAGGFWLPVEADVADLRAHRAVRGLALRIRDTSEQHEVEEQLRHRALHDPLTRLPNRALFCDRVEQALHRLDRDHGLVAVAFVDLDDFKGINDTLGHAAGDELLAGVAERLRASLRSMDTAARLGGDEFGVLLQGIGEHSELVQVAERLLATLSQPHDLGGEQRVAAPSIGVAVGGDGETAADLLRQADAAMYAAKRAGKGRFELYVRPADGGAEPAGAARAGEHGEAQQPGWFLRSEEQRAEVVALLERPAPVRPVLQPVLDLRTRRIAGHEALARFDDGGGRPPNAWFAQARRCGLGPRLEAAALRAALALRGRPDDTFLALNVSAASLTSEDVAAALPGDLAGLVLEISENELLEAGEALDELVLRLRRRGARLAVDDAGAGYAGFRQLMRVRPDLVKLDRSLVDGVAEDECKQALIETFVRLARRIHADVCAEGVESLDDLRALGALEVRYAQGWAVGPPDEHWGEAAAGAVAAPRKHASAAAAHRQRRASTAPPVTARRPSRRSSR